MIWAPLRHNGHGFPTSGLQVVIVIGVEHSVLTAGDLNEDSMKCHLSVVARLGHYAHGLVLHRMGWSFDEWAGVTAI